VPTSGCLCLSRYYCSLGKTLLAHCSKKVLVCYGEAFLDSRRWSAETGSLRCEMVCGQSRWSNACMTALSLVCVWGWLVYQPCSHHPLRPHTPQHQIETGDSPKLKPSPHPSTQKTKLDSLNRCGVCVFGAHLVSGGGTAHLWCIA